MWAKILLLFFTFSFLFKTDYSFDQDLGRHIKLGEIITQTGQIPKTNLFSYTNVNFPFINTHWLFEVFVYIWSITWGFELLLVLKVIIFLLSVWIIFKIIPRKNLVLLLPVGFIFLHVLRERLELRPEVFSFLFTASTYYILEQFIRGSAKLIFLLPLTQLIWVNTHIYFFMGLMLQVIFLIHLAYQQLRFHLGGGKLKLLGIIFILSVILSLLNPNGLAGLLYPLNVTENYGYSIVENQTMFLLESINFRDPNFLFVKISLGLVVLSLVVVFKRREWDIKNILLSVSGLVLALMHVRSFPYVVFLSLPATLQNFGAVPWNGITKTLTLIVGILLLLESYFYLNGDYYQYRDDQYKVGLGFEENVKGAMDFVFAQDLPEPIFNNFDIGSYIIYKGYPKYKVFADGRPEAYPADFFLNTYIPVQADYQKFKELEQKWDFKSVIFSHTDQTPWGQNFLKNIVKDDGWSLIFIDDFMVVFVKQNNLERLNLTPINLAELDTKNYKFDNHVSYLKLGIFLLNTGNQLSANTFFEKAYQLSPNSPIVTGKKSQFFW